MSAGRKNTSGNAYIAEVREAFVNARFTPDQIEERFKIGWKAANFAYNLLICGNRAEALRRSGYSDASVRCNRRVEDGAKISAVIRAFNTEFRNVSPEESAAILRSCIQRLQDFAFGKKRDNLAMDAVKALIEISTPKDGAQAETRTQAPNIEPERLTEALRGVWGDNEL